MWAFMNSKKLMNYMIFFNVIMGLLIFLSSEYLLVLLNGKIVYGANIFINFGYSYSSNESPPSSLWLPLPNFPFFLFIFTSIVNVVFIIKLRRNKE